MIRQSIRCIALAAALWLTMAAGARSVVDSVGITVSDMDRAVRFYCNVLSFTKIDDREVSGSDYEHLFGVFGARVRVVRMQLGTESIELMQFLAPHGRPIPEDSRSNDRWFQHVAIIVTDIDRAYRWLREHGVTHASTGPQTLPEWNKDAGGISAFYFRDPDGNNLEILEFPSDKGEQRWHAKDRLFLGIDHTAIVVGNTEDSLHFYRDALGMRIVGTAENYGVEQERLNNVFGARLRITALHADEGIGVELLEYLAPRTGRAMPVDTQASDLWHWQVNFARDDLTSVDAAMRGPLGHTGAAGYVSPGVVAIDGPAPLGSRALMLRDPDGHAAVFWAKASLGTTEFPAAVSY